MKPATSSNTSTSRPAPTGATCASKQRPRRSVRRQALVPRQRDGRPLAGRSQDRRRIWPAGRRNRQGHARLRQVARTHRLRLVAIPTCRPIPSGSAWCSSTATTASTTSRCTCISPTARKTRPTIWRSTTKLDRYIGTVASTIDYVKAKKRSKKNGRHLASTSGTSGTIPTQQDRTILDGNERLAACAAPARRHLQFRGRAAGRLHPQHLHPPLGRGEASPASRSWSTSSRRS